MAEIPATNRPHRPPARIGAGFVIIGLLVLFGVRQATADPSYGFIRGVEGDANLMSGGNPQAIEATANYPIQVGDELLVSPGGRMEVVLPDGNLVRIDGNSQLKFARLAESIDSRDDHTLLQLLQGQIQVTMAADPLQLDGFRIDTANASVFLLSSGSFRVFTDGKTWTQAIARQGYLDIETEEDTHRVGPGQQALIDGYPSPQLTVQAAAPIDELEQWANRLQREANTLAASGPYRRSNLSSRYDYLMGPLSRHGRWLSYGGSEVWRPHVPYGWRPYHAGWWIYTPAGLTWVSTEPWGWFPYHYGNWGHAGNIGWVWYPGHYYTPGAVYWYWGPSHVGWIPRGHYSPYFDSSFPGFPPFGYYGGFHHGNRHRRMHHWTFSPYERFGYRDSHRYLRTGAELQNRGTFQSEIRQGVIATDTRDLTPNLWDQPERIRTTLETPRSTRPRTRSLSPLGEAALSGLSTRPSRTSRQWDPQVWRRDHSIRPQPVSPYRRDTRGTSSRWRGQQASPMTRDSWRSFPAPQRVDSPYRGLTGRSRPGGVSHQPRSPNRGTQAPGRPSTARPGSSGGGRTMSGGARGSTSRDRGSG